jgi:pyruvate dehydrogenase E2 component (dihydrolipoamide acetyltransferase)
MTNRRKMLIATWSAPAEGNIMGSLNVDAGPLQQWMSEQSRKTGTKITYTHAVIKATALALCACPGLNGHIACGEFYPCHTVDVGCLVATERTENDCAIPEEAAMSPLAKGGPAKQGRTFDLANATLLEADTKCTAALAVELKRKAGAIRRGKDPAFESTKPLLRALPHCAIRAMLHGVVGVLGNSLGCTLSLFKVKPYMFGSAMVTSVGMMGLDTAWAPFTPWANTPLLVTIGACKDTPTAVGGRVVVRPILTITAVVDHRYLDGADAANLARVVKTTLEHPELLDFDYDTQA